MNAPVAVDVNLSDHVLGHVDVEVFVEREDFEQLVGRDRVVSILVHHVKGCAKLLLTVQLVLVQGHQHELAELNRPVSIQVYLPVQLHRVELRQLLTEELLRTPNKLILRQRSIHIHVQLLEHPPILLALLLRKQLISNKSINCLP